MTVLTAYKQTKVQDYSRIILLNKQAGRVDPTRTLTLRRAWMADMTRRFTYLKGLIRKAVVDDDVFGLREPERLTRYSTPGTRAFQFLTSSAKVDQFMDWLREQEKKGVLQTTRINQLGQAVEKPWTDIYIEDSYKRGVQRARYEMPGVPGIDSSGGIGAVMATPFHADRVGLLYSRTYSDLKGITSAMDSQISRVLAQCFVDGDGPAVMARKLNEGVDAIGKTRALTLARTETIRAHHAGMVQEYRNWGLAGVKVQAEWETAGFGVCPKCESLQGKVFTLDQIEGMIPLHPNCRCLALPVVEEEKGEAPLAELQGEIPLGLKDAHEFWTSEKAFQSFQEASGNTQYLSRDDYFNKVFGGRGQARRLAQELTKDSAVHMAIKPEVLLNKVVKGDRAFKNSLETGKGTFKTIANDRAIKERQIFGIAEDVTDPDYFPKYGFLSGSEKMEYEEIVGWGYGDDYVRFKNARVRNRTTISLGDSYDGNRYFSEWDPYENKLREGWLSITPARPLNAVDEDLFFGKSRMNTDILKKQVFDATNIDELSKAITYGTYTEAQIYGKVTLDDVDVIFVQSVKHKRELETALKKAGYPDIKVLASEYDSRLKQLMANAYEGPGAKYAASLTPGDVDNLNDYCVKNLSDRWLDTGKAWKREPFPEHLQDGIRNFSDGTMSIADRRAWLKSFYQTIAKKEQSGLPKVLWKDYTPSYGGWTDDMLNVDLLKNYKG